MLLLSARRDKELAGIAPLRRDGKKISFIGSKDVCDYMDFIAHRGEENAVLVQVLDYLENIDWDGIELHSLLPQSLALKHFAPLASQRGYTVETAQEDVSPELILPFTWDEYLSSLTTKDRHEVRRKMRRLEQAGTARFYVITDGEQLSQELVDFFRLFKLSAGEKGGFLTDKRRAFFEAMVRALSEKGYIKMYRLELDGIRMSYVICFDYADDLYLYNSAYNPDYAALNVGLMLKLHCLRESITERKKRFDFLRGDERYKYELGGQDVPVYRCVISRGGNHAHS